ncbi:MAG TPA: MarR family transcriptional regulator [Longimicrobiaceae bacterium]|nr:MarR family transcriptional regulator [Longimicrobiaceae bacterium]
MSDAEAMAVSALLLEAGAALHERLERTLEEACGLSLAKLGVLRHLAGAGGGLPLSWLAERLCCARSNVTQLVDRLEAEGLVERRPNPADRRRVVAVITPEGRVRCERGLAARARAQEEALGRLGAGERAALAALLRRLLAPDATGSGSAG